MVSTRAMSKSVQRGIAAPAANPVKKAKKSPKVATSNEVVMRRNPSTPRAARVQQRRMAIHEPMEPLVFTTDDSSQLRSAPVHLRRSTVHESTGRRTSRLQELQTMHPKVPVPKEFSTPRSSRVQKRRMTMHDPLDREITSETASHLFQPVEPTKQQRSMQSTANPLQANMLFLADVRSIEVKVAVYGRETEIVEVPVPQIHGAFGRDFRSGYDTIRVTVERIRPTTRRYSTGSAIMRSNDKQSRRSPRAPAPRRNRW